MFIQNGLFTSESVSAGHPDKLADGIADAILDAFIKLEPSSRVACEAMLTRAGAIVSGEFRTRDPGIFDRVVESAQDIVRRTLRDAGYGDSRSGIDVDAYPVELRFNRQPADIGQDAGEQGLVFGYACKETPELMPAPIMFAHRLARRQADLCRAGKLPWLLPGATSQVTFSYQDGQPVAVESVVLSTRATEEVDIQTVHDEVSRKIVDAVIPKKLRASNFRLLVNPTGRFVVGGQQAGVGLTGRKAIADTYGGAVPHGGGSFSGKDPSKADRSAAYMARFLARQVVARGWASRCLVQLAYAIGEPDPLSFLVQAADASADRCTEIAAALRREFDLSSAGIIRELGLLRPIYCPTAAYGHFGRADLNLPWERPIAKPELRRRFPYLVVCFMPAVFQREEIAIHKGPAKMRVGFRDSFVHHPEPFKPDGSMSADCKRLMIVGTLEAIQRTGFRMCLVWTANSCTYVEKDGSANDSDAPPSGGVGSGGAGGIPLPHDLEFEARTRKAGRLIVPSHMEGPERKET